VQTILQTDRVVMSTADFQHRSY